MKKKFVWIVIAMVAMMLSLVGCGVDIDSIGLPSDIVLEKGETQQLEIEYGTDNEVEPEKISETASKLTIVWTTSDEDVVTVDDGGLITAVGAGEADVTASVKDVNIASTTHIKVVITPTSVEVPDALALVTNGERTKNLDAKIVPADATEVKLAYESSDENVATVDENGLVTAVGDGRCTVTTYVVADAPATAETATQEGAAIVVEDSEAKNSDAVTDDTIATMPDNLAELDSAFSVTPDALSAVTEVTVTTKVEKIELDKTEGILYVGNSVTVNATVTPDNATDTTVTWTSSDESVATVDEAGNITAVSVGSATITATSVDDSSVSADYALTVQKKVTVTTKNNYSSSGKTSASVSGSASAGTSTAPAQTVTPSTPAAETPAPAPDPAPAPAEPAQPSGGDSGSSNDPLGGLNPNDYWVSPDQTDWTQDNSNGSGDLSCEFNCG